MTSSLPTLSRGTALLVPALLVLALAGCSDDPDTVAPSGSSAAPSVSSPPATPGSGSASPLAAGSSTPAPAAPRTPESQARAAVLAAAGSGAVVRRFELTERDGRAVYVYEVTVGSRKRTYSVDRETGEVTDTTVR